MGRAKTTETAPTTSLQPSDFVHLHNHNHHSLLDGLTKITELVIKVKALGHAGYGRDRPWHDERHFRVL